MPQEGIPGLLKYRVLNQNTGAVVIPDLPHLHQSQWNVRALQSGYPGSASVGDFRIPMAAVSSDDGRKARQWTDLLATGQKIEGYLGDTITGTPYVTGVITKAGPRRLTQPWVIEGSDTLWWLQQSQMLPGEVFDTTYTGLKIVQQLSGTQEVIFDDDFSSGSLAAYTNTGWSTTTSDPYFALPGVTTGLVTNSLVTTATWNKTSQYAGCEVSIFGTINPNSNATSSGEASIFLLSDSNGANSVMVRATSRLVSTVYNIDVDVGTWSGGVYTQQALVSNVFTNLAQPLHFQLTAVIYSLGTNNQFIRVILNGKDVGINWLSSGPLSGGIGLRFGVVAGGTPAIYVNRLQFHARTNNIWAIAWGTNRFAAGSQSVNRSLQQNINGSGQTHLDMMLLAAALDGFNLRKNPKAGFKADSIDYASGLGTDYSAQIVLEGGPGGNIIDADVSPVADLYATDLKLNATPGGDQGGSVMWGKIGAGGDMVLKDTMADVGAMSFRILAMWARAMQARKSSPMQATQVMAVRTSDLLSVNNGAGPRELDSVMVNIPDLAIYRQKAQIVGFQFVEGSGTMLLWLGGLPEAVFPQASQQRLLRQLEYLTNTYLPR